MYVSYMPAVELVVCSKLTTYFVRRIVMRWYWRNLLAQTAWVGWIVTLFLLWRSVANDPTLSVTEADSVGSESRNPMQLRVDPPLERPVTDESLVASLRAYLDKVPREPDCTRNITLAKWNKMKHKKFVIFFTEYLTECFFCVFQTPMERCNHLGTVLQ